MLDALPNRLSATAAAELALREAIVSGDLQPGDRLPPERVLSAKLGVSRLTLRAALATLSAAGLVSVRHGSGYTVRDVRETGGTDLLPGLVANAGRDHAAADLLRLRRHLAAAVLEAIVERPPSAKARRGVHRAIERFAGATTTLDAIRSGTSDSHHAAEPAGGTFPGSERDAENIRVASLRAAELAIVDADLGVVRSLLDATDSMILRVCLNPIIAVLRDSAPLRAAIYAAPETNLIGWRALGVWIEKPDAAAIPVLLGVLAQRDRDTVTRLRKTRGSR